MPRSNRSLRPRALPLRRSADLAGRTVALSADIPAGFDAPLAPHHKAIGRWLAEREPADQLVTRAEARRHIEQGFDRAVLEVLAGNTLADLRVVVLQGDGDHLPPAIAIICDSVGQIDLGWIEKTNVLRHTLSGNVAPVGWRAAAYRALVQLCLVLPMFDFQGLMDELSQYYWDGETDDEAARQALVAYHGADEEDLILPSHVLAKRPDYMLAENVAPAKALPPILRRKLRRLTDAYNALKARPRDGDAWLFDWHETIEYLPEYEDASCLPPMTLVPFDEFNQELDEVARAGMEMGFLNVAGLCPLTEPTIVARWFTSLRLGAELLAAAQDLIDFDPSDGRLWK